MIRLVAVTQHYGIQPVLKDIQLEIPDGKLTSIVGPNGMGKSTLLKVMAGMLSPQYGSVEIDGKIRRASVDEEIAIRRQVAYVPDDPWLPDSLTGREFLIRVGQLYKINDLHLMRHADLLFQVFELQQQADRTISSYSNGQKQKISLSAALISDASTLLLDEPFSNGLDPSGILALKTILRHAVTEKKKTVVIATPVPELVQEISDLVVIIKDGSVFAFGPIDELRQRFNSSGDLSQILQHAIHPKTVQNVDEYLSAI